MYLRKSVHRIMDQNLCLSRDYREFIVLDAGESDHKSLTLDYKYTP